MVCPTVSCFSVFPLFQFSWISMDICREIEELFVSFYWNCPKRSLKEMALSFVLCVEIFCISSLYSVKIPRDAHFSSFLYKKVEVIWHYCKPIEAYFSLRSYLVSYFSGNVKR